jgi:superfamily II DNA/RNA helicase
MHTRFVVLDEADRLLDATFQNDLKSIFEVSAVVAREGQGVA